MKNGINKIPIFICSLKKIRQKFKLTDVLKKDFTSQNFSKSDVMSKGSTMRE